jgi:hypothetical protein
MDSHMMTVLLLCKLLSVEESVPESAKLFAKCISVLMGNLGQHPLKTDICVEALAYLSLKDEFKHEHLAPNLDKICEFVDHTSYQPFVFMALNMCRDKRFD